MNKLGGLSSLIIGTTFVLSCAPAVYPEYGYANRNDKILEAVPVPNTDELEFTTGLGDIATRAEWTNTGEMLEIEDIGFCAEVTKPAVEGNGKKYANGNDCVEFLKSGHERSR